MQIYAHRREDIQEIINDGPACESIQNAAL